VETEAPIVGQARLRHRRVAREVDSFRLLLVRWFTSHSRDFPWRARKLTPYEVVVAELLLQRTSAKAAASIFDGFVRRFPRWAILADADLRTLEATLRSVGLWKRRSRSLRALARAVMIRGGQLPRTRDELEALPGIGQYVASAVLTQSYGEREPLLDTNMARVVERFFGPRKMADIRYDPYLQSLTRQILAKGDAARLNWAMLDLAALLCVQRDPYCVACPLREGCRYASLVGVRAWSWPTVGTER
jgi:A/G-specific adenine glycosylase